MAAPDSSADDSAITLTITGSEGSQILGGAGTGGNGGCAVELANGCSGVLSISGAVALVGGDASSVGTAKGGDAIGSRGVSGVVDLSLIHIYSYRFASSCDENNMYWISDSFDGLLRLVAGKKRIDS